MMNGREFDALIVALPELNARMIAKLATHVPKYGPWTQITIERALAHIEEEIAELRTSIADSTNTYDDVANECADVAAMAMIIMYTMKGYFLNVRA